jgi:hypothetical protein
MPLDFVSMGFDFGPITGSTQRVSHPLEFVEEISRVAIALSGFSVQFDNEDHELHSLQIITDYEIIKDTNRPTKVLISVNFLLRDYSGNIDDSYSGWVSVNVFYDTSAYLIPPNYNVDLKSNKVAPLQNNLNHD